VVTNASIPRQFITIERKVVPIQYIIIHFTVAESVPPLPHTQNLAAVCDLCTGHKLPIYSS